MKNENIVDNVLKKYKFQNEVPLVDQKKILKSKKKTFSHILLGPLGPLGKKKKSLLASIIFKVHYVLKKMHITLSFTKSVRLVQYCSALLVVILFSSLVIVGYNYYTSTFYKDAYLAKRATVISIDGNAFKTLDNSQQKIQINELIEKDSVIKTNEKSFITLQLGEYGIVKIMPQSKVEIVSLLDSNRALFFLHKGSVFINLKKLTTPSQFAVETKNSEVLIKGTIFNVQYKKLGTKVVVYEGLVTVKRPNVKNDITEEIKQLPANKTAVITESIVIRPMNNKERLDGNIIKELLPVENKDEYKKEKIKPIKSKEKQTLREIKNRYKRIDILTLYNERIIKGAIISRGAMFKIITPHGLVSVKKDYIKDIESE